MSSSGCSSSTSCSASSARRSTKDRGDPQDAREVTSSRGSAACSSGEGNSKAFYRHWRVQALIKPAGRSSGGAEAVVHPVAPFALTLLDTFAPPPAARRDDDLIGAHEQGSVAEGRGRVRAADGSKRRARDALARGARRHRPVPGLDRAVVRRGDGSRERLVQAPRPADPLRARTGARLRHQRRQRGARPAAVEGRRASCGGRRAGEQSRPGGQAECAPSRGGRDRRGSGVRRRGEQLGLPLGWSHATSPHNLFWGGVGKVLGLLVTAFALTLGAPFWFDLLGKVSNLRGSGPPAAPGAEEKLLFAAGQPRSPPAPAFRRSAAQEPRPNGERLVHPSYCRGRAAGVRSASATIRRGGSRDDRGPVLAALGSRASLECSCIDCAQAVETRCATASSSRSGRSSAEGSTETLVFWLGGALVHGAAHALPAGRGAIGARVTSSRSHRRRLRCRSASCGRSASPRSAADLFRSGGPTRNGGALLYAAAVAFAAWAVVLLAVGIRAVHGWTWARSLATLGGALAGGAVLVVALVVLSG